MKPVVVLNSGGFDSVVLMNYVKAELGEETPIHSLFFDYGQRNVLKERECSENVAERVGAEQKEVTLPPFSWVDSNLFSDDSGKEYVEFRNLVFLSYAISFAESIKAERIFVAFIDPEIPRYTDTSPIFLSRLNKVAKLAKIIIEAPFINMTKSDLFPFAYSYGVGFGSEDDYFTCNTPNMDLKPCGECNDCQTLKAYKEYVEPETVWQNYYRYPFENPKYLENLKKMPINEARILINNECQLHCEHCFYGFKEMVGERLPKEVMYEKGIVESIKMGVETIHFAGKEPLFDETIFYYAERMQKDFPATRKIVVTNGINVPKYAERLKACGFDQVLLSSDDILDSNGVRKCTDVSEKALNALNAVGIPVEMSIDLHSKNYDRVEDIIKYTHDTFGVKDFFVRTIRPIGNADDFPMLTLEQLELVKEQLCSDEFWDNPEYNIYFNLGKEFTNEVVHSDSELGELVRLVLSSKMNRVHDSLELIPEIVCRRYDFQITITPEGYVLGCAMEMASPKYDKVSAGNVAYEPLKDIVNRGKEMNVEDNIRLEQKCRLDKDCPFTLY